MVINNNQSVSFGLSDGYIEISNDTLIINDNAKQDRLLLLLTSITSIALSLTIIYKWNKHNDRYYFLTGIILLIINLGLIWKWTKEFMFIDNKIPLNDISYLKQVNIKFSNTKVGLLRIKGRKYRRVKMDLNELMKLSEYLAKRNIQIKK